MEQFTAFAIGHSCMGLHVRRASRLITRLYDEALEPIGLTLGQFSLLTTLAAKDEWGMQPLAEALGTDRSSLTAALKPLERRGLVASRADAGDGRVRWLVLTPAGSALLDQAQPHWQVVQDHVTHAAGGPDALAQLQTALTQLS